MYPAVVALLTRSGARGDAEDLAQVAFLRVYSNWHTIAAATSEAQRAYVFQAARNALRDVQRRSYVHPGGQPISLDRLRTFHDGADMSALEGESAPITHWLASSNPHDDPEQQAVVREALCEALGVAHLRMPVGLAALEVLLLADGCGSAEVVAQLRAAALAYPSDPDAAYFRTITVSALKGRLLRRRAAQRAATKHQQQRVQTRVRTRQQRRGGPVVPLPVPQQPITIQATVQTTEVSHDGAPAAAQAAQAAHRPAARTRATQGATQGQATQSRGLGTPGAAQEGADDPPL